MGGIPNPLRVALNLVTGMVQWAQAKHLQDTVDGLAQWLTNFVSTWGRWETAWAQMFQQVRGAWIWVQPRARQTGAAFVTISEDVDTEFRHVIDHIIPHSLKWLEGHVQSTQITPLKHRTRGVEKNVSKLLNWQNTINTWRKFTVDPTLADWRNWKAWFNTWPLTAVEALGDWLAHPGHFADWATPPLVGTLIAYLADDKHKQTRDDLTDVMVHAWAETPDKVWDAVSTWLVTNQA